MKAEYIYQTKGRSKFVVAEKCKTSKTLGFFSASTATVVKDYVNRQNNSVYY